MLRKSSPISGATQNERSTQQRDQIYCYAWGLASKGQLGCAYHSIKSVNALRIAPTQEGFFDICSGENHNLFLTDSLQLMSCGSNTYGQLGVGLNPQTSSSPLQQQNMNNNNNSTTASTIFRVKSFLGDNQAASSGDQKQQDKTFETIACGSEHSFALSTEGELFSWGLNFKGQLGLGDFENRNEPCIVESLSPMDSVTSQNKRNILQMIKRSKSKEGGGVNQGSGQRNNEEMKFSQTMNIQDQKSSHQRNNQGSSGVGGASKSIFNQSYKELKPSKSVDLSSFTNNNGQYDEQLFNQLGQTLTMLDSPSNQYLLKLSEKVLQVSCGSIHTLVRTSQNRLFSSGYGSTFALGHKNRESCSSFKQIEFFNGNEEGGLQNVGIKTIACGMSHSGCILEDGSVYLWGCSGDISNSKEFMERSFLKKPTKISFKSEQNGMSHRRRSTAAIQNDDSSSSNVIIEDLKLGEQFNVALSNKGVVFTWGLNDKGQLGLGNELSTYEPQIVQTLNKQITKIECGMKHCVALSKDYQLYAWGSNMQAQLGKSTKQQWINQPIVLTAFETAKPFKITCGSYHNVCLSYRQPKIEENTDQDSENKIVLGNKNQNSQEEAKVSQFQQAHTDDDCPNLENMKKLKGEIKRLRQELILKGTSGNNRGNSKNRNQFINDESEDQSDDSGFDEEEKAALRLLSPEQRKLLAELEQSGANKQYIKKKIKQQLMKQQEQQSNLNDPRIFQPCYEIGYNDLIFDKKISEGGYGIVHRGRWKYTTVAIKEIKREIIEQDKLEEFKNECAVMEVIRHPNVVLFLGACTKSPNLCIILEFCSRGSLWSLLHDMSIKMTWEYRKKFALDIAKGVYYLHTNKQPILHRDLKSLNVLLDHALNCKLADFGWTRIKAKVMTSKIGTYQWMAPEVINGFKYTEKADVFSFAVILWELATRKPPYYGIDGQVVSQRVVKEGLRPKISEKEAPGPFLDLMKRCWHDDQEKRPSFGEIIKELDMMNFKNIG